MKHALRSGGLVAFVTLSLLDTSRLSAFTWNFAQEGDTEGWVAWESEASGAVIRAPLHSEVVGGVWRVSPRDFAPGIRPIVELISPPIGRDSALFNRVRIRLRVLHTQSLESQITLLWKNPANKNHLGFFINAQPGTGIDHITLLKSQRHTYTADWQEVMIDSVASKTYVSGDKIYRRAWEDEFNEGGRFSPEVSMEPFPEIGPIPRLVGADLLGDERMKLIVGFGRSLDLLESSSVGWSVTRHIADGAIPLWWRGETSPLWR